MSKIKCNHCHIEFEKQAMICEKENEQELYFCCKGCSGVYHLLNNQGLGSFYDKLGSNTITPPKKLDEDLDKFDTEGYRQKYINIEDGLYSISLIIDGIHCSACVWLNEKVLHNQEGVIEAVINYSTNKAKILWDPKKISLSQIVQTIRLIGYDAYAYDPKLAEDKANTQKRDYYSRLLVAIFTTMNIMWIAIADYAGYFTGMSKEVQTILHSAEFFLASITLFYTGFIFYKGAYFALKNRYVNMDILVSSGATLAYLYSIYATVMGFDKVYFDSVNMIITFVFVGKYLEILSKKKAVDVIDGLSATLPTEVTVIKDNQKVNTQLEKVVVGDIIEVKTGEKIVIDGILLSKNATFDESSLSGESIPIVKKIEDEVLSGVVNVGDVIRYKATKTFATSTLSTIITLLEESMSKRPYIEKLANSISGYFSSVILLIALITFIYWINVDSFENSIMIAISVIVIACPCALGLATPVATLIGLSFAAKRGIIFKEASYLESMAKSDVLILDKTGTITQGKPQVVSTHPKCEYDRALLYEFCSNSTHPISRGVAEFLKEHQKPTLLDSGVSTIEAKGIKAIFKQKIILGGSGEFLRENGITFDELNSENSLFYYAIDGVLCDIFELKDLPKEGAKEFIKDIKKLGLEVVMLTGDNKTVASKIAKEVGIDRYESSLLPLDKANYIEKLQQNGKIVIMAGDGINDTLALSYSSIAVAMGSGSDIAINASDVILLDDSLESLRDSIRISKRTYKFIKQNLGISLVYNLLTIPLAVLGYVIPLVAALSMSLSSLVVIGNSFRIKRMKVE